MIIGIVAISENYAIGRDGKLPWHYSADLTHFKETTMGGTLVMGSSTWRSIGRALPGRQTIVLSRSEPSDLPEGVILCHSRKQVIERAERTSGDVFIIGGAGVFETFQDEIQRWIVTRIPETIEDADTFLPVQFLDDFELVSGKDIGEGLTVETFDRHS
ncbi:MAG TPA: dihydrofolate reductase [Pyrinomonadaceae bacterium]|jgi:dihydrofolate reductase